MNNNQVNYHKTKSFITIFNSIKNVIVSTILILICSSVFTNDTDILIKIIGIPFIFCIVVVLIKEIIMIFQGIKLLKVTKSMERQLFFKENEIETIEMKIKKLNKITNKLYTICFFIFLFCFLIIFDYLAIKDWST